MTARRITARTCPTCRRPILTGLDHDRTALTARVDPYPINRVGEAVALITGRPTYDLHRSGAEYVLDIRDSFYIANHPAGESVGVDVVAAHSCDAGEMPGELRTISALSKHRKATDHDTDQDPPF